MSTFVSPFTFGTATTTVTGSTALFVVQGAEVEVEVARDLVPAVGDVCLLNRVGTQWVAVARLYAGAPADPGNPVLPDPRPATVSGSLVVAPVETRSWREGDAVWRSADDDVVQGAVGPGGNHIGCAFYGVAAQSLEGSTVTAASVLLRRPSRGGVPAATALTLHLVAEATRPAGAPTLIDDTAGPSLAWGELRSFIIPTEWAQALVDGTAGGLAVYEPGGAPLVVLSGQGDWSAAMSVTIEWSR